MDGPTHLVVGLLRKPHGVKGDALVLPLTDEPARVFQVGRVLSVLDREGRPSGARVVVARSRAYQRAWLLHFEGMDERGPLDGLCERYLGIAAAEARPLESGEYYLHELVGLSVETTDGGTVGAVTDVFEAPQGWLLNVAHAGRERLIPFAGNVIRRVDRAERLIVIAPPEGLLEL